MYVHLYVLCVPLNEKIRNRVTVISNGLLVHTLAHSLTHSLRPTVKTYVAKAGSTGTDGPSLIMHDND